MAVAICNPMIAASDYLSHKISGRQMRDRGLFAVLRNHGDPSAAFLQIEDSIGRISLAKECLLWLQLDNARGQVRRLQERRRIERNACVARQNTTSIGEEKRASIIRPSANNGGSRFSGRDPQGSSARINRKHDQSLSIITWSGSSCLVNSVTLGKAWQLLSRIERRRDSSRLTNGGDVS